MDVTLARLQRLIDQKAPIVGIPLPTEKPFAVERARLAGRIEGLEACEISLSTHLKIHAQARHYKLYALNISRGGLSNGENASAPFPAGVGSFAVGSLELLGSGSAGVGSDFCGSRSSPLLLITASLANAAILRCALVSILERIIGIDNNSPTYGESTVNPGELSRGVLKVGTRY
jgi:hypothetical protein